jgi:hypothetical protein
MPASPLKKLVLTPVLVSAAVFATLSLPLAIFGKQPVTIQLQKEPIFSGQLKEIAAPYLGLASVLSFGAGFASVAITGWMNSTRKSSQVEAQLSNLTQNLREKEAQLEALKLSESQLEAAGLSAFLDEPVTLEPDQQPVINLKTPQPKVEALEAMVITAQPFEAKPIVQSNQVQRTVQASSSLFPSAQSAFGYARPQGKIAAQPAPTVTQLAPLDVSLDVQDLHLKLEQIREQMATLQSAIASSAPEGKIETSQSMSAPEEMTNSSSHLQVVNWSVNKMSS